MRVIELTRWPGSILAMDTQHPHTPARDRHASPAEPSGALRVAVVTETYPPEVNGVAMTMARVVDGLRGRGHSLQLVRPRQGKADVADRRGGLEEVLVRGLPIPGYPGLRMGLPCKRTLEKLWARNRPDVVHIATEGPLGWSALRAARATGLPVSSDFRTNFHAYSRHYGIGWLDRPIMGYLRGFHNRADCTMVPTEALRHELAACGFERLSVVTRGVDTLQFNPARRSEALRLSWGTAPDDLVVACVGRLAPEKNLDALLVAFDAVRQRQPRARLLLVGDGPQRAELQARRPDAVFAGQRSGEDLAAHYASADLFVFPSLTETFGNVTTEALASGLAVVAFDHAAAGQLIRSGDNGLLAPFGDSAALAHAAAALAADRPRLAAVRAQARRTALALGWDRIHARFEAMLQQVVSQRQQQGQPALNDPRVAVTPGSWESPAAHVAAETR